VKRWAVAWMNYFDNDLIVEIILAETAMEAIMKHSKLADEEIQKWYSGFTFGDVEVIKEAFFNADMLIGWVEIIE